MATPEKEAYEARIDLPQGSTRVYFFVSPDMGKWDPWWTRLLEHVLSLAGPRLTWRHEPVQNVFVADAELSAEQRVELMDVLRTAPAQEIERHRTLRRALRMGPNQQAGIEVKYFTRQSP